MESNESNKTFEKQQKERTLHGLGQREKRRTSDKIGARERQRGKEEIGKVVRVWVGMKVIMLMWPESGKGRATGKSQRQEWRVSKQC